QRRDRRGDGPRRASGRRPRLRPRLGRHARGHGRRRRGARRGRARDRRRLHRDGRGARHGRRGGGAVRDGYDWSVLQRSSDPVPGDPGLVQAGGLQYVEVADAIARSVDRLRNLDAGGDHVSEAVDALMDTAREVAESIQQAEGRYRETGEALLEYAPVLAGAQDTTLDAWVMASEARADAEQAESSRTYYPSPEIGRASWRDR